MKNFFIGDMHFGHNEIIAFDNRPYTSVEEMTEGLIENWNKKVSKDDTVYVLGDMFWETCKPDFIRRVLKSLNGKIVVIRGNHDEWTKNELIRPLISKIKDYLEIYVPLEDGAEVKCVLSHFYIPLYNGHRDDAILLHAHSHKSNEAIIERHISRFLNEKEYRSKTYNVGCMYWDYSPVTLDEILKNS